MMRSRFIPILVLLGVVAAGLPVLAQSRKLPADIPVVTTIADAGGDWALRAQSDRRGAYATTTVNRVVQVESTIYHTPDGQNWSLTTYYNQKGKLVSSNRTVFFDLSEQVAAGTIPTPILGAGAAGEPVPYGQVTSHLTTKCAVVNRSFVAMAEGTTIECPGSFRFRAPDGSWYRLSYQPDNYSQVDRMNVNCVTADGSGCKVWTITPAGALLSDTDSNRKGRQTLLLIDSAGTVIGVGGDYLLSFSITIAR